MRERRVDVGRQVTTYTDNVEDVDEVLPVLHEEVPGGL